MPSSIIPLVPSTCPFCTPDPTRIVARDQLTVVLRDAYPVTEGHSLVVPARHLASLFDLSPAEFHAVWQAVAMTRRALSDDPTVAGVNIGLNDGVAAGQTVPHAHVHVIPRRTGDVADPRGGVRWVVPERAAWWETR